MDGDGCGNDEGAVPVSAQHIARPVVTDVNPLDAGTLMVMSGHLDVRSVDPGVPVICYGLRTDFRTRLFPGASVRQRIITLVGVLI